VIGLADIYHWALANAGWLILLIPLAIVVFVLRAVSPR
jgi:hypothetical protein